MTSRLYSELASQVEAAALQTPRRALAVGAHPDDIEFGAGATLAKWAADGCEVTMVVMTDGSKGTWDFDQDPEELIVTRQAEARAAAAALGAAGVHFVGHVDGELEYSMALRQQVCGVIRQYAPDVLLSHDPWQRYQLHPDHRATGWAASDGVVAARDHLFYPDLGPPHRPSALLLWSADEPNHWEPVDDWLGMKIDALLCHSSQGTTTMGGAERGDEERSAFAAKIMTRAEEVGAEGGIGPAEAFRRLTP